MRLWVAVLLCETEVDDVDLVSALADAHQKVVWLDVTVDEVSRVDVLDARDLCSGGRKSIQVEHRAHDDDQSPWNQEAGDENSPSGQQAKEPS